MNTKIYRLFAVCIDSDKQDFHYELLGLYIDKPSAYAAGVELEKAKCLTWKSCVSKQGYPMWLGYNYDGKIICAIVET